MDLYEEIVQLRQEDRRAALATIIRRLGSTPRKDHAKMLIYEDGRTSGTVGGGCVESEVWQKAQEVIQSGHAQIVEYELTEKEAQNEGLMCGGTVQIYIEPILPDPKILLLGAGHVAQAIANAAHPLGFRVAVLDDRESFSSKERFPEAEEILVRSFDTPLDANLVNSNTFILIVTRGHSHDFSALKQAIQMPARYVGLLGSRRKIRILVGQLLDEGVAPELFEKLYAPIGIEIGSATPEEIAISVVAEFLAIQKGVHQRSNKQKFIRDYINSVQKDQVDVL